MASVLPSLGAAAVGGAFYTAYAATRRDRRRREAIAKERGPKSHEGANPRYPLSHSAQPASSLKDTLLVSQVGSKNVTFVKTFIGVRGTRMWQYYLPGTSGY